MMRKSQVPEQPQPQLWRVILGVAFDPGSLIRNRFVDTHFALALSVSGVAFMLFFLQTGLDRARDGQIATTGVAMLALVGFIYGTVGISMTAVVGWAGARLMGSTSGLGEAVRAFALAYSAALIYTAIGLLFNLIGGWNTAVAFGVTGVLWAVGPMISVLKGMVGGRGWPATLLATGCGLLVLVGWVRVGGLV
jgi:hypothetical protein